jgi:hypothetical protein
MSRNRPAFPGTPATPEWREGMTLRDYFAAKAMQGIMSEYLSKGRGNGNWSDYDMIAKEAYRVADEMLKQREQ